MGGLFSQRGGIIALLKRLLCRWTDYGLLLLKLISKDLLAC